jgi:hypothetical protein
MTVEERQKGGGGGKFPLAVKEFNLQLLRFQNSAIHQQNLAPHHGDINSTERQHGAHSADCSPGSFVSSA